MQKLFTQKAFFLLTLLFVLFAAASFAAFRETEEICTQARACLKEATPAKGGEMLWEVVSRHFLALLSI